MVDSEHSKLFVGGISWETTEELLRDHFNQYGEVLLSVIAKDRITGSPRGFGFITFSDPSSAVKALEDQHVIAGRTVEVKKAIPRSEQQQNSQKHHHHHQIQQNSSRSLGRNSNGSSYGGSNGNSNFRTKKIFVGGLSANLTEEAFKNYFERFGRITDVVVMHDNTTNRPRGFGFITFDSEEVVENIMQNNFHEVGGKLVEVKRAVPKEVSRNGNSGSNSRGGTGKVPSLGGYSQENYWPHRARYEIYPGHVPFPTYGAGGYYYGGVYVSGYPMSGYGVMGYGVPWVASRSPWNGVGMLGGGPAPYASTAFYPAGVNGGVDVMRVASTPGAAEISDRDESGNDQVLDNAAASQIDGGRSDVHASGLEAGQGVVYNKKNRKAT
ncbi:hypothetical protein Ancab_028799 [Ancistrocladus abbreviatus]